MLKDEKPQSQGQNQQKKKRGRKAKEKEFGNKVRTEPVPEGTICPRCHTEFQYLRMDIREKLVIERDGKPRVHSHTYYYALHYEKDSEGNARIRPCYLGAHLYDYVKRFNDAFDLMGAYEQRRYIEYLRDFLATLQHDESLISIKDLIEIIALYIDFIKDRITTEEELQRLKNLLEDRAVSITMKIHELKEKDKEKSQS